MNEALDEALGMLRGTAFEYGPMQFSNHGPMVAEALCALGRAEDAVPWVESYRRCLSDRASARHPISVPDWRAALGDASRVSDWVLFFERELKEAPWRDVLNRWIAELAPGLVGAAFHGAIRTGHAVRALATAQTELRLGELASALAYWAASYTTLPEADAPAGGWLPSRALESLESVPRSRRSSAGDIMDRLRPIYDFSPFALATSLVDTSGDPGRFISDLTETFAGVYLANSSSLYNVITFVHTVTGPAAVRLMAPHLRPDVTSKALRYCWQGVAAVFSVFSDAKPVRELVPEPESAADLIARAVDCGDEHAIKFTEACLREHSLNPKPVYLAAASDAIVKLGGPTNRVRSFISQALP